MRPTFAYLSRRADPRFCARLALGLMAIGALCQAGCPTSGHSMPNDPAVSDAASQAGFDDRTGQTTVQPVRLDQRVDQVLRDSLQDRSLDVTRQGAWQILHGILAYGRELEVVTPAGNQSAIDYLLKGGRLEGFEPSPADTFIPDKVETSPSTGLRFEYSPSTKTGQGHHDQWLAILAQTGLTRATPIVAEGRTFRIEDVVRQTEYDIPLNLEEEFSWTLIALLAFRDTDHIWTARDGDEYSIELLLEVELGQSLESSVCGGTHRLIAIAMALAKRRAEGRAITGAWMRADQQLMTSIGDAQRNQNADGSYSLAYLHRPGWARDLSEQLGTTGHVLEFLSLAADEETLRSDWVRRSVSRICDLMELCRDIDLECGVLYHAIHGLKEYQARVNPMSTE